MPLLAIIRGGASLGLGATVMGLCGIFTNALSESVQPRFTLTPQRKECDEPP